MRALDAAKAGMYPELPDEITAHLEARQEGFRPIRFNMNPWASLEDIGGLNLNLSPLGGAIRRDEMVVLVKTAICSGRHADAFVLAMLWGYGPSGYGPYRTRKVLGAGNHKATTVDSNVARKLRESAQRAKEDPTGEKSFYYLNNKSQGSCKHLGPSFFTKWLYAASAQGDARAKEALPILDEITRGYVNEAWRETTWVRRGKTPDYVAYTELLNEWAKAASRQQDEEIVAVDIEEAIFDVAQQAQGVSRTQNRNLDLVVNPAF